mmetsp:Transcript_2716/g.10432  ORF Transcript_2716/g.10432 Transcript_2716/m.10432 type:complete len:83 (-) Transcript_2716:1399-1647(-)
MDLPADSQSLIPCSKFPLQNTYSQHTIISHSITTPKSHHNTFHTPPKTSQHFHSSLSQVQFHIFFANYFFKLRQPGFLDSIF